MDLSSVESSTEKDLLEINRNLQKIFDAVKTDPTYAKHHFRPSITAIKGNINERQFVNPISSKSIEEDANSQNSSDEWNRMPIKQILNVPNF